MMNLGNDVIGGHHSKLYGTLLGIANRSEAKKQEDRIFKAVEMDRLHMEAHKMDMMRSFHSKAVR